MSDNDHTTEQHNALSATALQQAMPGYEGQIVASRRLQAQEAQTVPPEQVLPATLGTRVAPELFVHQAEALRSLAAGDNVVVTTSTSSGKTWVYALQIAQQYLADSDTTALCLYPMKALTRDQERELNDKLREEWGLDPTIGVYDGDTPSDRKRRIRETANVLLTNPAGLNVYLPRHRRDRGWQRFYSNLDLVVIDEAHQYTGVTGTHVAWILRRLRRILRQYGSTPQFVCTTATIGNPAEHAKRLTGLSHTVVDTDGSSRGRRDIVLWQPPRDHSDTTEAATPSDSGDTDGEQAQRSAEAEAASVTAHLVATDKQTLQFCTARQGTEIAAKQIADAAGDHPAYRRDQAPRIEPYHAGLGKQSRRQVETGLTEAHLDAVATTSALELGIDIGSVDATVTAGYPGTKQSFWQQIGRAGRGHADALSVLVGGEDAMDAYIMDHPEYLFDGPVEDAVVSIDNEAVYADHLLAAAHEHPLKASDADLLGGDQRLQEMTTMWQEAGMLAATGDLETGGVRYTGAPRPQSRISLYNTGGQTFEVVRVDGDIDHDPVAPERAYRDYHEGALFLHAGQQFEVIEVDDAGPHPRILVESTQTGRYTQTLSQKRIGELQPQEHRSLAAGYDLYFGRGTVEITYDRYLVRAIATGEVVRGPLPTESPSLTLDTELMWVSLPENHLERTIDRLDQPLLTPTERAERDARVPDAAAAYTYAGGLHAAEHGVIQLAPLVLLIDNHDIGGLSMPHHPDDTIPGPVWFVHDGIDGGVGFARAIYDHFESIANRTHDRITGCDCHRRRGCPRCVMSEDCGNNNDPLDRATADLILEDVLAAL